MIVAGASRPRAETHHPVGELVGEDALSETDRRFIAFADSFEHQFLSQHTDERRELDHTMELAWKALSTLPRRELTMISAEMIRVHYQERAHAPADSAG
jgi:V/A-type H+-transporting ATPase subunit B